MRHILAIAALLTSLIVCNTKVQAISWKTYTDSRQINSLFEHGSEIWAGTSGGVLCFGIDGAGLTKYTNSEGLGDNEIDIGIAAGGYIWFGSATGKLSRFDPTDGAWKVFILLDRDGNGVVINDMATSGDFLWLATNIGISKFDMFRNGGEVKETYRRIGGFTVESSIVSVTIDDSTIIAASGEGIATADVNDQFLQNYERWNSATDDNSFGFPQGDITSTAVFNDSIIVGTLSGLYVLIETDTAFAWENIGLPDEEITQLYETAGSLFVTTQSAIFKYHGDSFSQYDLTGLPSVSITNSLYLNGSMIIGTKANGVFIETADWTNVFAPGPASNEIVDIDADSEGKILVVAKQPYVSSFDGVDWKHYELPWSEGSQRSLIVDMNDDVWIGTWANGALRLSGDILTKYYTANSSLHGSEEGTAYTVVMDLSIDESGIIWFACYSGYPMCPVSFYDPFLDKWDYYSDSEGFTDNFIFSIHVSEDVLWTGYENTGLFRTTLGSDPFDHSDVVSQQYTKENKNLPSDSVRVITSDLDGVVWIGTNAGMAYYDEGIDRFIRVELPTGAGPQVNAFEVDPRNNLWIGTSNSLVLLRADGSGFEVFNTSNSRIAGEEVTSLHFDNDGYLWIGTLSGISRLNYNIGVVTEAIENVVAYPNPFIIPDHEKVFFSYNGIANVSIFTLAGELVKETSTSKGWDGRNESGEIVAGGMYIFYIATADGDSHTGKIALIRE